MRNKDFRNHKPIEDELLAFALLAHGWNDRTHRRLMTRPGMASYIEIMICNEGYTKDLHSGSEYYPVADWIATSLKTSGCVEGKKCWGYTDHNECTLTEDIGFQMLKDQTGQFVEEAQAFLLREHPELPLSQEAIRMNTAHTLTIMRFFRDFEDFFVALEVNEERDQVRRTRGTLKLLHAHEWMQR